MKFNIFSLGVLVWMVICAQAQDMSTYRQNITSGISGALNRFGKDSPGTPVPDLLDLVRKYSFPVEEVEHNLKMPFTNVFWLLKGNSFPAPAPQKGEVVAVMTTVSYDGRYGSNAVRNVVYKSPDGVFRSRTMDEAALQIEAQKIGFQLPVFGVIQENIPDWVIKSLTNKPAFTVAPDGQGGKTFESTAPKEDRDDSKPVSIQENHSETKRAQSKASNAVPLTVATATPGSGTSWFGLIGALGIGLLASIFLLFRAKQK